MNYFLLAVSIIASLMYNLVRNAFSKRHMHTQADLQLFNLACSAVSALVLFAAALLSNAAPPSVYTLLLGLVFGIFTALAALFNMQALSCGPVSYTTLIVTSSMMIPALSGWALYGETVGPLKFIGIALMLVSVFLSIFRTDGTEKKASAKWLTVSLLAMLFTGFIGITQKLHQSSFHSEELMYFLVIAFFVSALYSVAAVLFYRKKQTRCTFSLSPRKTVFWMAVGSGVAIALANVINLYLSGVMESIVFFPTVNGANLLLLLLASVIFLHEKLSRLRWCGIIIGCAAIALLCVG
ncbi:MAG: EamA family transporter [Clostridiales bacterium]|nr:EamA family transporter [Clostridiales bacterium]